MPWVEVLRHRRAVLALLYQARKHAILAGDRATSDYIGGAVDRQRERVRFAEKMVRGRPGFFGFVGARFAAGNNAPHTQAARGSNNAG
jgi:hypothetical protein